MAISIASLQRQTASRPPIVLIHGGPGIGKTTFAANAPDCAFIRTEDGLGSLTASAFPIAHTFDDVMEAIKVLYTAEHDRQWLVLDSLSALEPLIWAAVAAGADKANIEALDFGKGYIIALDYWRQLVDGLSALANDRKIGSILIAHTDFVRFESPETEAYDRAQIKLHKRAFQMMYERADVIGYASPKVFVRKEGKGFNERNMAVASGERLLHLAEKPAFIAKNRYRLPDAIPLDWNTFHAALMSAVAATQPTTNTQPAAQAA